MRHKVLGISSDFAFCLHSKERVPYHIIIKVAFVDETSDFEEKIVDYEQNEYENQSSSLDKDESSADLSIDENREIRRNLGQELLTTNKQSAIELKTLEGKEHRLITYTSASS